MRNQIKDLVCYGYTVAVSLLALFYLGVFWLQGDLWLGEPNHLILGLEIALAAGMLALGIERVVKAQRRAWKSRGGWHDGW